MTVREMVRRLSPAVLLLATLCVGLCQNPGTKTHASVGHLDNQALPTGQRVAIVISGIAERGIFEHALDSLNKKVVSSVGEDRVHVFVHIEPMDAVDDLLQVLHDKLDPSVLKGYIIAPAGAKNETMGAVNEWTVPAAKRIQFDRVRDAFWLILAQEQHMGQRYGWACRMRTDTIWLSPWNMTALRTIVGANTVAGKTLFRCRVG